MEMTMKRIVLVIEMAIIVEKAFYTEQEIVAQSDI